MYDLLIIKRFKNVGETGNNSILWCSINLHTVLGLLSTTEIKVPPLRNRKDDIHLLFRKFASDFGKKYNMPTVRLDVNAQKLLTQYSWNGNVRQLRNVAEQLSVLEEKRDVSVSLLQSYLPDFNSTLPAIINKQKDSSDFSNEREILYKVLFDMKKDLNDLKKITEHLNTSKKNTDYQKIFIIKKAF